MAATITATYTPENDDWTVTVTGPGETLTGKAPGIIAARDRADQLVEKLAGGAKATVVHLLNGSALEFTHAYMSARLTRPEEAAEEAPAEAEPADEEQEGDSAKTELQEAIDDADGGVFTDLGEAIGTPRQETGDPVEAEPPVARRA
ncbi:hypothetical protein [Amycolatopsis sp. YIM 10]|uniref:hypothetical protein n=1 Tax=Amycolatopsis sp. YIM 10 TaxID=2653857 RepID=UPI0012A96BD1|nr:hypothetical protein [Amycolatopsis sp. YIM 10]QFU86890.1 hypothetical protein YIM_08400 [Amycolatopsis sp. YIM 10]